jgi:hypothetical protein
VVEAEIVVNEPKAVKPRTRKPAGKAKTAARKTGAKSARATGTTKPAAKPKGRR